MLQRLNSVKYETARYRRYSADAHSYYRWDNFASLMVFLFQALEKKIHVAWGETKGQQTIPPLGEKNLPWTVLFLYFFCSGLFYLTIGLFRMWLFHGFQSIYFLPLLCFFGGAFLLLGLALGEPVREPTAQDSRPPPDLSPLAGLPCEWATTSSTPADIIAK